MHGIYCCTEGHLFQRGFIRMLLEANLGPGRHRARCPVDGAATTYERVDRSALTDAQVDQAQMFR